MTITSTMIDNAVCMIGTLVIWYYAITIHVRLLVWAFSDKFVVTINYCWDSINDSKSFGVKAINEDYALIKAFKKFVSDEPAHSSFDLRNVTSYKVAKLK